MIPGLSAEQRRAMEDLGTPLPLYDARTRTGYVVFPADVVPDPAGGFMVSSAGFSGTGGGDTPEEAMLALSVLLRGAMRRNGGL